VRDGLSLVTPAECDEETRQLLTRIASTMDDYVPNVYRALAISPELLRRWRVFANYLIGKSTLDPRHRELVILRTSWKCRCDYEWGQHALIGRRIGLNDRDLHAIATDPAELDDKDEAVLVQAVDEMYQHDRIGDGTWNRLREFLDAQQLVDTVFTIGHYRMLAAAIMTLDVDLDSNIEGLPAS
jgi:4-carboxymuconolactone decarboxylase